MGGLVENLNYALHAMPAKHSSEFGPQWDVHLQVISHAIC